MKKTLVVLTLLALPMTSQAANLVVNGGFELGTVASNNSILYYGDPVANTLTGWDAYSSAKKYAQSINNYTDGNATNTAHTGSNYIELDTQIDSDGMSNGGISQTFNDLAGTFDFSFYYTARTGFNAASNGLEIYWNNVLVSPGINRSGVDQTGNVWIEYKTILTAISGPNILGFKASGTQDNYGIGIDDVSLTQRVAAVPEAETYSMLLVGLALLRLVTRRRDC